MFSLHPTAFWFALMTIVVHAQNYQSGFISLDCGIPEGTDYTDGTTGIYYTSDSSFVDGGLSQRIAPQYNTESLEQHFKSVRSFPEGKRNCYTRRPAQGKGNKYLIRASFMYGNYDAKSQLPTFDLHLGVDTWDTVIVGYASDPYRKEIIHVASSDQIYVCLVNIGYGTPFISALELRLLNNTIYTTKFGSLDLNWRGILGSTTDKFLRYKDDIYDRMWQTNWYPDNTMTLSTSRDFVYNNEFQLPSTVMSAADTPQNASNPINIVWSADDINNSSDQFYFYMHFAEVEELQANQSRQFDIYLNGDLWYHDGPVVPNYLSTTTICSTSPENNYTYAFTIIKTTNSTLPPIINAMEAYVVKQLLHSQTDENDAVAMMNIKSMYGVTKNWQGDPCAPEAYVWVGLNCSYNGFDPPRIISLDLSYNKLTGQVPDFLSGLPSLKILNLQGNSFTGPVPKQLFQRSKDGWLSLSIDGVGNNTSPSDQYVPFKKKQNTVVVPVLASVLAALFLLLTALVILWMIKRRKQRGVRKVNAKSNKKDGLLETKSLQFTYSEVLSITNNFERVIGKGGFGTVYHGYVGDTQVAVKMLSPSSSQGYKEFQTEANILRSIYHKNLTSLVGYCNEGANLGIIYEYMDNGNLRAHLSDTNSYVLNWEERLRISIDVAQGLEYLHHGCKPVIIHRDVKPTNILLNENFQAKLADFGLSRIFPIEGDTHVSTIVAGTPGYLDLEYYTTNRLTEKSDVYSFGIVLLEIITGGAAITKNNDETGIIQWVSSLIEKGDVKNIVDSRLQRDFDVNSVWKAVELTMACVSPTSARRPTMNYVVTELKQCLATEMGQHGIGLNDSIEVIAMNVESEVSPSTR